MHEDSTRPEQTSIVFSIRKFACRAESWAGRVDGKSGRRLPHRFESGDETAQELAKTSVGAVP
jgi:hypothetical protein